MILTLTLNPSVDISYHLDQFKLDTVNRVSQIGKTAGGKGLNVTRVLSELGDEVLASGLLGGELGTFIESQLDSNQIQRNFYHIQGQTRNCIAILHEGQQTEILEQGPTVSTDEAAEFKTYLETQLLNRAQVVAMSGSLPKGLETSYYADIVALAAARDIPTIVDSSGASLESVLNAQVKPTVIKPNIDELNQLINLNISEDVHELKVVLEQPIFEGIEWIIVSLGSKGAFAKHHHKYYRVNIPTIEVVNPVGSGDSTVAGIASALLHHESDEDLLKKANTLGMLNAQEKQTGHINIAHYDQLYQQIKVVEV